jgi:hypothetical protein
MEVVLTILIIGMVWTAVRDTIKRNEDEEIYRERFKAHNEMMAEKHKQWCLERQNKSSE